MCGNSLIVITNGKKKKNPKYCSKKCYWNDKKNDPELRFWQKVNKKDVHECWEWTGAIGSTGYGNFHVNGKYISGPRYSYILHYGKIKYKEWVLHKCDNRKCVNPDHLFLGTQQDNTNDMVSKNRQQLGITHWNVLLNNDIVIEIRNLRKNLNMKYKEISKYIYNKYKLEIQEENIGQIILRKRWRHI
jgi:hypothetical protein